MQYLLTCLWILFSTSLKSDQCTKGHQPHFSITYTLPYGHHLVLALSVVLYWFFLLQMKNWLVKTSAMSGPEQTVLFGQLLTSWPCPFSCLVPRVPAQCRHTAFSSVEYIAVIGFPLIRVKWKSFSGTSYVC